VKAQRTIANERDADRLWSKVLKGGPDDCWTWQSPAISAGYGAIYWPTPSGLKAVGAHRAAYNLATMCWPLQGEDVMHSCDNKRCCNPRHLSVGTRNENMRQAHERGLIPKRDMVGENHPLHKVTERQVIEIRARHRGGETRSTLAKEFGFTKSGMDHLIARRTWSHVP
jgi:hypothetical protein